jgi:hypothetical protein
LAERWPRLPAVRIGGKDLPAGERQQLARALAALPLQPQWRADAKQTAHGDRGAR